MNDSRDDVAIYKVLSRTKTSFYSNPPTVYIPNPDTSEYGEGYIFRFFAKKANDKNSPVVEISENSFNMLRQNPFYVIVSMRWKITGPLTTMTREGVEYEEGVFEYNTRQTQMANEIVNGTRSKLRDLYQFYKTD